jgi:hypothetical protein
VLHRVAAFCFAPRSPLFEIALVFVRFNHVACVIVNANHFIVHADEKLTAFVELERAIHEPSVI